MSRILITISQENGRHGGEHGAGEGKPLALALRRCDHHSAVGVVRDFSSHVGFFLSLYLTSLPKGVESWTNGSSQRGQVVAMGSGEESAGKGLNRHGISSHRHLQ